MNQSFPQRDLKPANNKVNKNGRVKVLDFGFAEALKAGPSRSWSSPESVLSGPGSDTSTQRAIPNTPAPKRKESTDVAQRAQPLERLGIDLGEVPIKVGEDFLLESFEGPGHLNHDLRVLGC